MPPGDTTAILPPEILKGLSGRGGGGFQGGIDFMAEHFPASGNLLIRHAIQGNMAFEIENYWSKWMSDQEIWFMARAGVEAILFTALWTNPLTPEGLLRPPPQEGWANGFLHCLWSCLAVRHMMSIGHGRAEALGVAAAGMTQRESMASINVSKPGEAAKEVSVVQLEQAFQKGEGPDPLSFETGTWERETIMDLRNNAIGIFKCGSTKKKVTANSRHQSIKDCVECCKKQAFWVFTDDRRSLVRRLKPATTKTKTKSGKKKRPGPITRSSGKGNESLGRASPITPSSGKGGIAGAGAVYESPDGDEPVRRGPEVEVVALRSLVQTSNTIAALTQARAASAGGTKKRRVVSPVKPLRGSWKIGSILPDPEHPDPCEQDPNSCLPETKGGKGNWEAFLAELLSARLSWAAYMQGGSA